jgi:ketosteroid isomerase-like protein
MHPWPNRFFHHNLIPHFRHFSFPRFSHYFGVNVRCLFFPLLLIASVTSGAGTYQRTRDGRTLVWNDDPKRGEEATWSGKRDKNRFAIGSGTLTWYKVESTVVTGSSIPDARRHAVVVSRYSGEMVQGKFEGAVIYTGPDGKKSSATFVDGSESAARPSPTPRQAVAPTPTPAASPTLAARQSPTPVAEPKSTSTPLAEQTPTPRPERTPIPTAQTTPPAMPEQTAASTPTPTPSASQPAEQHEIVEVPTQVDESLRSLAAPPPKLRESVAAASPQASAPSTPPPLPSPTSAAAGDDARIVAALDNQYQAAVKNNDPATMDRILADDFVLMTGRGNALTKADLIKEAREKRTIYERQEEEEGTQKVRVWGDAAVVTALLRIKGTRDQKPLDYKVWFSDTYVRTPAGWRYVFGQASTPLSKTDAK